MHQDRRTSQIGPALVVALIALAVSAGGAAAQDATKCRATIAKEAAKYEATLMKSLAKCEDGLLKAGQSRLGVCSAQSTRPDEECEADSQCPEGACEKPCPDVATAGKLEAARAKMQDKIVGTCEGLTFMDMGFGDRAGDCLERCAVNLSGAESVANCVACVGEGGVENLLNATYASLLSTGDKDVLKCQQTIAKTAGKHFATVRKSLQKCQDAVLKGKASSCPDGKAESKITGSADKLAAGIAKKCTDALIIAGTDPAGAEAVQGVNADCLDLSDVSNVVGLTSNAAECVNRTSAACTDAFAVGEPLACNPGAICGNGRIEPGETCDDGNAAGDDGTGPADSCPDSCRIAACTASGTRNVTVSVSASQNLVGLTVLLDYNGAKVSIPGQGNGAAVQSRLFSSAFAMTPNDLNYTLRNVLLDPTFAGVTPGAAFSVRFDTCSGADATLAADLACTVVEASSDQLLPVSATCSVSVQ